MVNNTGMATPARAYKGDQYIKFFEMYSPLLTEDGIILSDNLYFHDLLFL